MHDAGSSSGHQGLAFSLSRLLAEKMAMKGFDLGLQDAQSPAAGAVREVGGPAWLIQRCPVGTMAQLDGDDGCFCGKLDPDATICHSADENDRHAICVEDLRDDAEREAVIGEKLAAHGHKAQTRAKGKGKGKAEGERGERSKRRKATCGLEFRAGFEPDSKGCPVGYTRIGEDENSPFICQDVASPYSCGVEQRDCYAQPGVLRAECFDGACEIMMCQGGWRFHILDAEEESGYGAAACVPSRPLFFNPPV